MTTINKEKVLSLKSSLKQIAKELKQSKKDFKQAQRDCDFPKQWKLDSSIKTNKFFYRHSHIAYSLMKGKTYEQIESNVREGNIPDWKVIKGIQDECST
jgi:hypothetical protein